MRKDRRLWIQDNREAGRRVGEVENWDNSHVNGLAVCPDCGALPKSQEIQEEEQVSGNVRLVFHLPMEHIFEAAQCTRGYRHPELRQRPRLVLGGVRLQMSLSSHHLSMRESITWGGLRVEKLRALRTWEDTNLSSQRRRNYLKKKLIKNNQKEKLLSETP